MTTFFLRISVGKGTYDTFVIYTYAIYSFVDALSEKCNKIVEMNKFLKYLENRRYMLESNTFR